MVSKIAEISGNHPRFYDSFEMVDNVTTLVVVVFPFS